MEFERALFRVYDRSMEGLVRDQPYVDGVPLTRPSKICGLVIHLLWIWAVTLLALVAALHISFVGDPGCIGRALADLPKSSSNASAAAAGVAGPHPPPSQRWLVDADARQRPQLRGQAGEQGSSSSSSGDGDGGNLSPLNLDKVLQIRVLASNPSLMSSGRGWSLDFGTEDAATAPSTSASTNISTSSASSSDDFLPDYVFTQRAPLLYLDAGFLARHNIHRVNMTLDEACVTKGPGQAWLLRATAGEARGLDTVVINQLMYSLRGDGFLRNVKTNETWIWRASQLPPPGGYDWPTALSIKCNVLVQAALAFLLLSAVTAIVVRMLMTSGVVVLFPLFILLRRLGVFRVLDFRLLSLSYPWLGVPLQRLRARRKPLAPFIMAHVIRVFVLYIMYEASQLFFAQVLYGKSVPAGLEFACFGLMMVLEYFALIFVRSALSIKFFPRAAFLVWMAFHCYLYSVPYGFTSEALLAAFLLLLCAAMYTVLVLELPACRSSVVSLEAPRAYFTRLEIPAVPSAIPPAWSLFMPLNALAPRSVYAEEVPERPSSLLQQIIVEMEEGGGAGGAFSALNDGGAQGQEQEQQERRRRRSRGSEGGRSEGESGGDEGERGGQIEEQEHRRRRRRRRRRSGDSDEEDGEEDEDQVEVDDTVPLVGGPFRRSHD